MPRHGPALVLVRAGRNHPVAGRGEQELRSRQVDVAGGTGFGNRRRPAGIHGGLGLPAGFAKRRHGAGGDRDRIPDPCLLHRLHGSRRRLLQILRLPQPIPVLHAGAGAGEQLRASVRRLGGSRILQLRPDRVLLSQAIRFQCGQQGVHRQSRGGRRVHPRHAAHLQHLGHLEIHRGRRGPQFWRIPDRGRLGPADVDGSALLRGGDGQVGPTAFARVAAGRDGRPDACLGADPRRHDGHRGRVFGSAVERDLHARAQRHASGRGGRRA